MYYSIVLLHYFSIYLSFYLLDFYLYISRINCSPAIYFFVLTAPLPPTPWSYKVVFGSP